MPAWHASLDAIAAWRPERIAVTHFGVHGPELLDATREALARQAELAAELDLDAWVARLRADLDSAQYEHAVPYDHLWLGLERARSLGRA